MSTFEIDLKKFKETATNLHASIGAKSNLTLNQVMQELSQSMFSKPYEEVQKTILIDTQLKSVTFIKCATKYFVFVGNKCVLKTDDKPSPETVKLAVKKTRSVPNYKLEKTPHFDEIPHFVNGEGIYEDHPDFENPKTSDVIKVAKLTGDLKTSSHLIYELETKASSVLINGISVPYLLNGDWRNEILNPDESENSCIWFAEATYQNSFFEWYFSLIELSNAEYSKKNKEWYVTSVQNNKTIVDTIKIIE